MPVDDEFAKEIAKQLPIKRFYKDAVSPAAREAGKLGEDLLKTLRLALAPLQITAALQDRFRRFVENSVNRVPPQERVAPPAQIVGPVLESIRYETEGTPIDEMFSELLSCAMSASRVKDAHPSFPMIIRQLSGDEAKILQSLATMGTLPRVITVFELKENGLAVSSIEKSELACPGLDFPENLALYTEHLEKLGLIKFDAEKAMQAIITNGKQTGGRNFFVCKLTELGTTLMRACGRIS